jgi:hypothetical protein
LKKGAAFLLYVAALAVFADVAWQFQAPSPPPPDPSAMLPDEIRALTESGMDLPEHLYPENSYVDELTPEGRVLAGFRPDFSGFKTIMNDKTVRLYRIMEPGFAFLGLWMVGLKNANGKYVVFTAKGARDGEAAINCEKPFEAGLGDRTVAAWEKVLLETRPTNKIPYMGADGGVDHFGLVTRFGSISGKMWVPRKPFKPGWLSQAAVSLATICEVPAEAREASAKLETALNAIETAKPN